MCGRYRLGAGGKAFLKHFGTSRDDYDWSPRLNIAPTQEVPTIRQEAREPKRVLSTIRWGLIPYWAKDASIGQKMINAKAETIASKPAFQDSVKKRRCLIPADGFYEWKKVDSKTKQPYCFMLSDESVFAFAGIWASWTEPDTRKVVETCSILTTTPNMLTSDVHDRMPVILRSDDYDLWLDPGFTDHSGIAELLKPYDAHLMKRFPVSTRVNGVRNDDSQCAQPVELPEECQGNLSLTN
jgi:putative SOS response-associated peptidase YedK